MKDYYKILGLAPQVSSKEIRERYRSLVTACHPDKFQDSLQKVSAEETIKEVNQAYEVLGDPQRRAAYDRQRFSQKVARSVPVKTKPTPYPRSKAFAANAPVTPIPVVGGLQDEFATFSAYSTPHWQQKFFGRRGQALRVWIDRRANVMLLDETNYARYLSGRSFEYLGGYPRQSPIEISIPANGLWRLVVDLGGESGRIGLRAQLIV